MLKQIKNFLKHTLSRNINYIYLKLNKPKKIFTNIYNKNGWKDPESFSGSGSNFSETQKITEQMPIIFKKYSIKSILDLPCGDFNWMRGVDLKKVDYIGGDIVKDIVNKNKERYSDERISFKEIDIINNKLPTADLIFVRDCFVHLSFKDIKKSLENIKKSGSKYLMTTSFVDREKNYNIATGEWRTLNFQLRPFNFPTPLEIINEGCKEGDGEYKDKSLAIWKISDLK